MQPRMKAGTAPAGQREGGKQGSRAGELEVCGHETESVLTSSTNGKVWAWDPCKIRQEILKSQTRRS